MNRLFFIIFCIISASAAEITYTDSTGEKPASFKDTLSVPKFNGTLDRVSVALDCTTVAHGGGFINVTFAIDGPSRQRFSYGFTATDTTPHGVLATGDSDGGSLKLHDFQGHGDTNFKLTVVVANQFGVPEETQCTVTVVYDFTPAPAPAPHHH